MFAVSNLTRSFGGVRVLSGVDLKVTAGELVCLIGPNGCGKTTLFNIITGQLAPSGGEVTFDGRRLQGLAPHRIARLRIARKFQVPSVFEDLTVMQNLMVAGYPLKRQDISMTPADPAHEGSVSALADAADRARRLLEDTHLAALATSLAGRLSHGQRQWLEIAMALFQQPRLLLLDEPTAGMTSPETLATAELIRKLCASATMGCLVVEHDMRFVERLDARVLVMVAGRIVADGRFEDIRRLPAVREAYLGSARAVA